MTFVDRFQRVAETTLEVDAVRYAERKVIGAVRDAWHDHKAAEGHAAHPQQAQHVSPQQQHAPYVYGQPGKGYVAEGIPVGSAPAQHYNQHQPQHSGPKH